MTNDQLLQQIEDNGGQIQLSDGELISHNGYTALNNTDFWQVCGVLIARANGVEIPPIVVDKERNATLTGSHRIMANWMIDSYKLDIDHIPYVDVNEFDFASEHYDDAVADGFWSLPAHERCCIADEIFED